MTMAIIWEIPPPLHHALDKENSLLRTAKESVCPEVRTLRVSTSNQLVESEELCRVSIAQESAVFVTRRGCSRPRIRLHYNLKQEWP